MADAARPMRSRRRGASSASSDESGEDYLYPRSDLLVAVDLPRECDSRIRGTAVTSGFGRRRRSAAMISLNQSGNCSSWDLPACFQELVGVGYRHTDRDEVHAEMTPAASPFFRGSATGWRAIVRVSSRRDFMFASGLGDRDAN